MLKVAVIGAGIISCAHVEGYLRFPDRCKIVAVCDIFEQEAKRLIAQYKLKDAISCVDYKALIDMDIDLVSICTPTYTHAAIAAEMLRSGKHVLVEEPMAASLEECDAMITAAEESGKILSVVAQHRFRTPIMRLKSVLNSGMIGKVVHAQVDSLWWRGYCYYELWWRGAWEKEGGGSTLTHSSHHIDLLLWMMGKPLDVQAVMANTAHDNAEVEDLSITILRFPNGSLGQLTSSLVHHGEAQRMIFQGTEACIAEPWQVSATISKPNGLPERHPELEQRLNAYYESLPSLPYELHTGQIDDVLRAIEQGTRVLVDGESGKATMQLITAVYKSASLGTRVTLPLSADDPFYTRKGLLSNVLQFHRKQHTQPVPERSMKAKERSKTS
ncbi:oxidoreductase [Insulibacter thermoxylanivorax]|uniref:Oxidoreductase n=1 Tax=Insulibacter thermoxylanivorax TaxID=2749268 RepID=A0A916VFN5_9BACL|nr:Gfo/Idh/MocA family oxidoreductase [Insulibacter thermoxylanivorax]GFR37611.1 oxidoreductase [Insulibacter thermoxylanivorax]